jgi:hypothetical protein
MVSAGDEKRKGKTERMMETLQTNKAMMRLTYRLQEALPRHARL